MLELSVKAYKIFVLSAIVGCKKLIAFLLHDDYSSSRLSDNVSSATQFQNQPILIPS